MTIQKKLEPCKNPIWFLSFILLVIPVYLGQFNLSQNLGATYTLYAASLAAYGLLAFKIYFLDGHSKKELFFITCILAALALGVVFSGIRSLFSTGLLTIACKGVSFDRIAKTGFCFCAGAILLNGLLVLLGVLADTTIIRGEAIGNGNVRHTMGFGYPNTFALWGMVTVFAALLVRKKGIKIPALCLVFTVGIFLLTDSKAAFLASMLAIVLCLALRFLKPKLEGKNWVPWLAGGLVAFTAFGFVALALLYQNGNRAFEILNTLFSQRLGYANQGFRRFGVSLFGAKGVDFGWDPVDSLYAFGPICLGLVPCLVDLGLRVFCVCRGAKNGRWEIAAVALAGALYSTMEYSLINPIFLPVFAACALLESDKNESNPSV